MMSRPELDEVSINTIRFLSVDAVQQANSGHPGLPMGAAAMAMPTALPSPCPSGPVVASTPGVRLRSG